MGVSSGSSPLSNVKLQPLAVFVQGDVRWEKRAPMNQETDVAIDWPAELMTLFNVRMKAHGNGLDRELMQCDRRYALQQLMYAHTLPDVRLHKLAAQLLFYFEEREIAHKSLH